MKNIQKSWRNLDFNIGQMKPGLHRKIKSRFGDFFKFLTRICNTDRDFHDFAKQLQTDRSPHPQLEKVTQRRWQRQNLESRI